jgi:hypothetical protein
MRNIAGCGRRGRNLAGGSHLLHSGFAIPVSLDHHSTVACSRARANIIVDAFAGYWVQAFWREVLGMMNIAVAK